MTSSFNFPGGNNQLFRAEPVKDSEPVLQAKDGRWQFGAKPTLQWVLLKPPNPAADTDPDESEPEDDIVPVPPAREPDYVGQIVAVPVSPGSRA